MHVSNEENKAVSNVYPLAIAPRNLVETHEEKQERLPFTVSIVTTDKEMSEAFHLAEAAYRRHVGELVYATEAPSVSDREDGYAVLLARSKFDDAPVGTMKIQITHGGRLNIEQSVALPSWLAGQSLAGANRLGVSSGGAGRMVKLALFKAYYLYCLQAEIDWMVIAARTPLDKQYADMMFQDVFGDHEFVPLAHAANIPHRVMAFDVAGAAARWGAVRHPLYNFIFATRHSDIRVAQSHLSLPLERAGAGERRAAV